MSWALWRCWSLTDLMCGTGVFYTELAAEDLPPTLEKLYDMAIAIDNCLRERVRSLGAHFRALPVFYRQGHRHHPDKAHVLPPHREYDCAVNLLPGTTPRRGRLFSLSTPEKVAMEEYIREALANGFIQPLTSPAGAGFFFVGKKDGTLRPCIDYRGLNAITVKDHYPLPLMNTTFEALQQAAIFTKLDLRSAYNLIRIRQWDEWKTAFITPSGHYKYRVMPFGLMNAPAVFQRFINEVKLEKSEFHVPKVSFLGFIVSKGTLAMDPAKIHAVRDWPRPSSLKVVQRFLGFANFFRRFVRTGRHQRSGTTMSGIGSF
ncbi:hypothetical protein NFI96_000361 [Prochilodus magdalenae]|nr:hypothetical protein NFI96_000361 [Prochilodus magdalenae]